LVDKGNDFEKIIFLQTYEKANQCSLRKTVKGRKIMKISENKFRARRVR